MNETVGPSDGAIQGIIKEAYAAVASGDPTRALRLVLTALQATGGQAAAAPALSRVLGHLTANNQINALQELTELFARAASVRSEEPAPPQVNPVSAGQQLSPNAFGAPFSSSSPQPQPGFSFPLPGHPPSAGLGPAGPSGSREPFPRQVAQQPAWSEVSPATDSDSMSWSGDNDASAVSDRHQLSQTAAAAAAAAGPGGLQGVAGAGGGLGSGGQEATSGWSGQGPSMLHAPILSETGREGFLECALDDGSSYVCGRCQGLVLRTRRQQHEQYWCQAGDMGGDNDS